MRIAIDYNSALRQVSGIGRYTRELIRAVAELRSGDQLVLFYAARDLPPSAPGLAEMLDIQASNPKVTAVPIPLPERWLTILWQRARLPIPVERWTGPVDLVHAPDFVLPPTATWRTIVTVHDLSFRIHPEAAHQRLRRYLERAVPRSLGRATHVLADSQSTARDLERLMGVSPDKVSVLYPGIGTHFRRVEEADRLEAVRQRYKLPRRFVVHVGTIEPRKNLERLITAFSQLPADSPGGAPNDDTFGLVLGGKPGWLADGILAMARQTPGVQLIGPVAEEDLPTLYSLASGLVYPTLYEGFGFPPLEAFACGTPAVTSNTSSLPELVGDLAEQVDPHDIPGLVAALRRLRDDRAVAERARIDGPKQAARFTWPEAAQQLLDLYHALSTKKQLDEARRHGART